MQRTSEKSSLLNVASVIKITPMYGTKCLSKRHQRVQVPISVTGPENANLKLRN